VINFQFIGQLLTYGVINGALYGLAALGLSLVYGVMSYLNIAHCALVMLGAYVTYWFFHSWGIDPFVSIPLTAFILFLLGALLYKLLLSGLIKLPEMDKVKISLLLTFGLLVILPNAATILWTADTRSVTPTYSGNTFDLFGVRLPYVGMATIGLAVVVIFSLHLILTRTYFGKSIRAVSIQPEAASLVGISINKIYWISFGIGAALAAIAGTIVSMRGFSPPISFDWTNKALVVVILAGMGSINGVFFGGLLLGVVEALSVLFISSMYRDVVGLILFVLILIFRPKGLLGKKTAA
jgi:branched-chain amino acid transport system permease protein